MPRPLWSDDDGALLIRWVGMAAQLFCDGEPDDAIAANLAAQMRQDLAGRDESGIRCNGPALV